MSIYPGFALHASSALISSLWEGLVLVAVTALFLLLLPQTTARFRFTVWTVVFLLLGALPVANVFFASHAWRAATAAPVQLDPRWSYALTALWLGAVAARAAHLAIQAIKLRTLWNSAVRVDCETLGSLVPGTGRVQICTSAELDRPSVIGFFAPRILIPAWLFNQLTPTELHQIVLHELEHLRRRDDWLNLLQKLALVVFPLNPALFWIDRRLAAERELACDDGVLEQTRAPRAYATCLTSLAELRLAHRRGGRLTALALGAIGAFRRPEFSRRIESILDSRRNLAPAPSRALVVAAAAGILGLAAALTGAPQLVAFSGRVPQYQAAGPSSVLPASPIYVPTPGKQQARFLKASLRLPAKADPRSPEREEKGFREHAVRASHKHRRWLIGQTIKTVQTTSPQPGHWMVLTSWHETAPTPVFFTLPDGRTFLTTYPATPTQVDWLVIQL